MWVCTSAQLCNKKLLSTGSNVLTFHGRDGFYALSFNKDNSCAKSLSHA